MEKGFFYWMVYILENYGTWFLKGMYVTLLISFVGTLAGFVIGLAFGALRATPCPHGKLKTVFLKILNAVISCYV